MERAQVIASRRELKEKAELLANSTEPIQWRNTGNGSLRIKRRIIKPGEVFEATQAEISQNFRDVLKPIGSTPEIKTTPIPGVKPVFKVKEREIVKPREVPKDTLFKVKLRKDEKGVYDVVSVITTVKEGKSLEKVKLLNSKGLTKEKAGDLLKALNG